MSTMSKRPQVTETLRQPVLCIGLIDGKALSGRVWPSLQLKASLGKDHLNLPQESNFTSMIIRGASSLIGQRVKVTLLNDASVIGVAQYTVDGYMGIIASEKARGFDISVEDLKSLARTKEVSVSLGSDYA